jgi:hypothetical protein
VPEGATPKDGPSAGIAMATAIVSVITGIPVRRDIRLDAEIDGPRADVGRRRRDRLLHHVAQVAGHRHLTGNLRDVMKESISAAASYVRSRAVDFGVEPPLFTVILPLPGIMTPSIVSSSPPTSVQARPVTTPT